MNAVQVSTYLGHLDSDRYIHLSVRCVLMLLRSALSVRLPISSRLVALYLCCTGINSTEYYNSSLLHLQQYTYLCTYEYTPAALSRVSHSLGDSVEYVQPIPQEHQDTL